MTCPRASRCKAPAPVPAACQPCLACSQSFCICAQGCIIRNHGVGMAPGQCCDCTTLMTWLVPCVLGQELNSVLGQASRPEVPTGSHPAPHLTQANTPAGPGSNSNSLVSKWIEGLHLASSQRQAECLTETQGEAGGEDHGPVQVLRSCSKEVSPMARLLLAAQPLSHKQHGPWASQRPGWQGLCLQGLAGCLPHVRRDRVRSAAALRSSSPWVEWQVPVDPSEAEAYPGRAKRHGSSSVTRCELP